ncbi:MAG: MFS transporter [Campylobacteraceae bacterium]|jgi:MFS family permease|nr:MFS transporter [Campylobacteraceae bacterium]
MKTYLKLLISNKTLLRLSIVQLICYFGAWFSHMAIYSLLIELHAPIWTISATAVFTFIPSMILAPFTGVLIDKLPTKPLMITLIIIEIITVCMLLMIDSLELIWLLLMLVFVRMGVGSAYFQTEMSLLPKILKLNDLKLANEIHSIIWSISYTAGMGIAGFYVYMFGTTSAFITDALLYCVGFLFIISIKIPSLSQEKRQNALFMLKDGFLYLKKNPKIIHIIFLHAIMGFTAYDALIALLADKIYYALLAPPIVIGSINSLRALALTIGSTVLSKYINIKTFHLIFFAQGIGIIIWGILQYNFYLSLIGIVLTGFFSSSIWSYTYTLLQQSTDKAYYGRVIAYNDMCLMGMSALTSFLIGFLYRYGLTLWRITLILGVMFLIAGIYYMWVRKTYM